MSIFNEILKDILNNPYNIHQDKKGTYSYITKGVKQYAPEPLPISIAEEEAKEFFLRLNQIKSETYNILHNDEININKKEKFIQQATQNIKTLFIEMMTFIFFKDVRDDYLIIEYNAEYERAIIKGHFRDVFCSFMDIFDIKLNNGDFYQKGMNTLLLNNNTNQEEFMKVCEQYYQKYNNEPLQPKKSTKKLKK